MFKVIAVTARELTPGGPTGFLDQVDRIAASGVAALILREKDLADDAYLALASQVAPLCRAHGVDFIPHGSIARAQALGCAKVQLPWLAFTAARAEGLIPASRDLQSPSPRASESRPSPKSQVPSPNTHLAAPTQLPVSPTPHFGVSIHSLSEALSAAEGGASWLIAGNVFASACKPDAPARGLAFLAEVCRAAAPLPVYAIGGITRGNIAQAQDAGAAGACLRSACMEESWTRA